MTDALAPPPPQPVGFDLPSRLKAAGVHLGLSALVAALAALLVFGLWYPEPFRQISGGRELFTLIVAVDVVVGPLITFAVFDRRKPWRELRRDLAVVALLQLAALGYGMQVVFQARPVVLALEAGERLRVVRAIDLVSANLAKAPTALRALPWTGRLTVATREPTAAERFDAVQLGLAGIDLGMRPEFWLPPENTADAPRRAARPLADLRKRHPAQAGELERSVAATGRVEAQLGYLPLLARRADWVALIDLSSGEVVGHAPIDGF
ncbi:MAG TPA: TfpX/TfpZ family type IV pilin accessory protein [Methylibium sp.]|nr:TfpX/TfpZ family type IV pilin accessory protein [Methylibium sp.]